MKRLHSALLLAFILPAAACATSGSQAPAGSGDGAATGEPQALVIEVSHTLAREGAVVIWLLRLGEQRWPTQLGRIIPPSTQAFEIELDRTQGQWVLEARRATDQRAILNSRRFAIEPGSERIFWDLTSNIVRVR